MTPRDVIAADLLPICDWMEDAVCATHTAETVAEAKKLRGMLSAAGFVIVPREKVSLGQVLRMLYASEINVCIEWLWDGGFEVSLGGDNLTGYEAHKVFNEEDFDKIAPWLIREACQQYRESTFAREHAPAMLAAAEEPDYAD